MRSVEKDTPHYVSMKGKNITETMNTRVKLLKYTTHSKDESRKFKLTVKIPEKFESTLIRLAFIESLESKKK